MSGVFKAIGRVFKAVVKTVIKIAPYALAAAAVVFTAGAALGVLPAFGAAVGGVVSSLGLSAAVTGALTGAITSAGFGAAIGFVTGGKKGLQKGALMGALTGGVLGFVNPATFGIVKGAQGVTTMNALTHSGNAFGSGAATSSAVKGATGAFTSVPKGIAPVSSDLLNPQALTNAPGGLTSPSIPDFQPATGSVGTSSSAAVAQAGQGVAPLAASQPLSTGITPVASATPFMESSGPAAAAAKSLATLQSTTGGVGGIPASGGNGILDLITKNPTIVGSVLSSIGAGGSQVNSKDLAKEVNAQIDLRRRAADLSFGGAYSGKPDPFGIGNSSYLIPQPRYYYDANTKQVVDRQAQGG